MKEESPLTHVTLPSMPPPISSMVPAMATSATPVTTSSDNTVPTSLPGVYIHLFLGFTVILTSRMESD